MTVQNANTKLTASKFLIIDLEANFPADGNIDVDSMEIIEIGALWADEKGAMGEEFQSFVRPKCMPTLSESCINLTKILQKDIDCAHTWPRVAKRLNDFANLYSPDEAVWASWGNYDRKQIDQESLRYCISNPLEGLNHVNLKSAFAKQRKIKQTGMLTALSIVGIKAEGEHHRALADAVNIARLLPFCLG